MKTSSSKSQKKSRSLGLKQALPHLIILPSVALVLSAVMTWANIGFGDEFFVRWLRSFGISLIVLPMALICVGLLEQQVDKFFVRMHSVGRKLMVAFLAAVVIETVLALANALVNNPWDSSLGHFWWLAFSRSLPVGILIGLFMSFYMKPKLDSMKQSAIAKYA